MWISFAQAVYGSFPFWGRGYDLLAWSPNCRSEWLAWLRETCPKIGQPLAGSPIHGLFALKADRKTWAIIGLSDQGTDDHGRPGAMAFHALFVGRRDYERLGANPFLLASCLRSNWTADTRELPVGTVAIDLQNEGPTPSGQAVRIAAEIRGGRRRVVSAEAPIDDLARQVWTALPISVRRTATLATWSFADGLDCDLRAVLGPPEQTQGVEGKVPRARIGTGAILAAVVGLLILGLAAIWLIWRPAGPVAIEPGRPPSRAGLEAVLKPEDVAQVRDRLAVLADRMGLEFDTGGDPSAVMARISESARYRGRWLSDDERRRLRQDPDPEAVRALSWDEHLRRFAADRPLPNDFDRGPVRWQLAVLAWSFHLETTAGEPPVEVLRRLEDWLSVDVATRPSPLSDHYPTLADYGRFLSRMPRR